MKKWILYSLVLMTGVWGSCEDDPELPFENINRIYFENYTHNSQGNKVALDSILYSFGEENEAVTSHTIKIVVRLAGRLSGQPRTYRVVVGDTALIKSGKTTMVSGKDYEPVSEIQTFRANSWTDTLYVVVNRENLDKSFRKQLNKRLILRLEASEDFEVGAQEASEMVLVTNDYLTEPSWWESASAYLYYFHPEKLKILISFDTRFAVKDVLKVPLFDIEYKYAKMLKQYLEEAKIIDEEPEPDEYIFLEKPEPVVPEE